MSTKLKKIFAGARVVGVVAGRNQGKSALVNKELVILKHDFKERKIKFDFYVYGVEENIEHAFEKEGINIIHSKQDILDIKIKSAIVFIDEFADIFPDISGKGKQLEKIKRFFNRLAHNNIYLIICTAQDKYYNNFMCGLIDVFFVKQIDFDSLVNGTYLKTQIKGIANDDYRLYCPINTFYIVSKDKQTTKHTFTQLTEFDSKKEIMNPFKKCDKNNDKINGKKGDINVRKQVN